MARQGKDNRNRSDRYPRTYTNKDGDRVTVKNSSMDYLERVKQYVDLKKVKSRNDLNIQLAKKGLLGKYRQYKQLNIASSYADLTVRGKPKEHKTYTEQTFYKGKKKQTVYRDKKTGKFIKKPSGKNEK